MLDSLVLLYLLGAGDCLLWRPALRTGLSWGAGRGLLFLVGWFSGGEGFLVRLRPSIGDGVLFPWGGFGEAI